ncbi:hypothetical protein HK100_000878 [Physocladia obscura]|uniref:Uncharacterized protein n=1 Tax=Physocladia obscura TaxID=109957 RepID=A0AAD5XLP3_9FUNG|nr:hypothetical protein HK100_000878 [Physocladia obscura]
MTEKNFAITSLDERIAVLSTDLQQAQINAAKLGNELNETCDTFARTKQTFEEEVTQKETDIKNWHAKFQATVSEKDSSINQLIGQVAKLVQTLEQSQESESSLKAALAKTRDELKAVQTQFTEKVAENEQTVQVHMSETKSRRFEFDATIAQKDESIAKLNKEYVSLEKKLRKTETEATELNSKLVDTVQTLGRSELTLAETTLKKNAEIQKNIEKFNTIIVEKNISLDDLNSKISNLSQNLATTKEAELNLSIKLNDTIQELESFKIHHAAKVSDHQQAIQLHVTATDSLKEQFDATLTQKNSAISALDNQIIFLSQSLHQTESKTENLESVVTEIRRTLEYTKQAFEEKIAQKELEIKDLQTKFETTILAKDSAINDLNVRISELVHNLDQSRELESNLSLKLTETTRELETVQTKLAERIAENERTIQVHVSEINIRKSEVDATITDKEKAIAALTQKHADLETQVRKAESDVAEINSKLSNTVQMHELSKLALAETTAQKNAEIQQTGLKFDAIITEKDNLRSKISDMSQILATSKESEAKFSVKLSEAVHELESIKLQYAGKVSNHEEIIQFNAAATERLKSQFDAALAQKDTAIVALDDQVASLSRALQQAQVNISALKITVKNSQQSLERTQHMFEEKVAQKDSEVKDWKAQFQDIVAAKNSALQNIEHLNSQISSLLQESVTKSANFVEILAQRDVDILEKKSSIDGMNRQVAELAEILKETQLKISDLESKVQDDSNIMLSLEEKLVQKDTELKESLMKYQDLIREKDSVLSLQIAKITELSENLVKAQDSESIFSSKLTDALQNLESFKLNHAAKVGDNEQIIQAHFMETKALKSEFDSIFAQKDSTIAVLNNKLRSLVSFDLFSKILYYLLTSFKMNKLEQTESKAAKLESLQTESIEKFEVMKRALEDKDSEMKKSEISLSNMNEKATEFLGKFQEAETKVAELELKLRENAQELARTKDFLEKSIGRNNNDEDLIFSELNAQILKLNEKLSQSEKSKTGLLAKLNENAGALESMKSEIDSKVLEYTQSIQTLETEKKSTLNERNGLAKKVLANLQKEIELENKLKKCTVALESTKSQMNEYMQNISNIKEQHSYVLSEKDSIIQKMAENAAEMKKQLADIQQHESELQSVIEGRFSKFLTLQQQLEVEATDYKRDLEAKETEIKRLRDIRSISESQNSNPEEITSLKASIAGLKRENEDLISKVNEKDLLLGKMKSDAIRMAKRLDIVEKNLDIQISRTNNRRGQDVRSSPAPFSPRGSILKGNEANRSSITSTASLEEKLADSRLSISSNPSLTRKENI